MPPFSTERRKRPFMKCCPHCDKKWSNKTSGDYKEIPDLDKLYLHFIHLQQVCTRALKFVRGNNRPSDLAYLADWNKKPAAALTEKTKPDKKKKAVEDKKNDEPKPANVKTEVQTISIGDKTYRIMRDVKLDPADVAAAEAAAAPGEKRKLDSTEGEESAKKAKVDDAATENGESEEKKDAEDDDGSLLTDKELRMSLMAVMNGEEMENPSPQFEMAKRMWKVVMDQMAETEQKKVKKEEASENDEKASKEKEEQKDGEGEKGDGKLKGEA